MLRGPACGDDIRIGDLQGRQCISRQNISSSVQYAAEDRQLDVRLPKRSIGEQPHLGFVDKIHVLPVAPNDARSTEPSLDAILALTGS